jgi:hypothetical protein
MKDPEFLAEAQKLNLNVSPSERRGNRYVAGEDLCRSKGINQKSNRHFRIEIDKR